jgi:hypothetical protein
VSGVLSNLKKLVKAPEKWTLGPEIIAYYRDCDHEFKGGGVIVHTATLPPELWPTLKGGNFIFFSYQDGELVRQTGPVDQWTFLESS